MARQSAFAGVAVVWIFNKPEGTAVLHLPQPLTAVLFLLSLTLAFDLLQYTASSLVWGFYARKKEKENEHRFAEDPPIEPPPSLNWPGIFFFWTKLVALIAGYGVLARFMFLSYSTGLGERALNQWIFGESASSPWTFGWDALAALATVLAVVAALFVHFHQQRIQRRADERRVLERTRSVAPQLAADVMQLSWQVRQGMRAVMKASKHDELSERSASLVDDWKNGHISLQIKPGSEAYVGDLDWLHEQVRLRLAELKAQVSVANAMWHKLLFPPHDPFRNVDEAVGELLKSTTHQLIDTSNSAVRLLEALDEFLPEPLKVLRESLERESTLFLRIYEDVPVVARVRQAELLR